MPGIMGMHTLEEQAVLMVEVSLRRTGEEVREICRQKAQGFVLCSHPHSLPLSRPIRGSQSKAWLLHA